MGVRRTASRASLDKSVGEGGLAIVLGERKCADDFAAGPVLSEELNDNDTRGGTTSR
jgi:hypothetical protein